MKTVVPDSSTISEFWEIVSGYQRARVLFTFADLGVADILNENSMTALEIAKRLKIHPLAMERFLNTAVNAGFLQLTDSGFANTDLSKNLLSKKSRFELTGIIRRHAESGYQAWENLTEKLQKWEYGKTAVEQPAEEDQGADAMADQHNLGLLSGYALAEAFDFSKFKKVLDIGGGTGATSIALCKSYPELQSIVFDLPENADTAKEFVAQENLSERIQTIGGDLQKDDLPDGFDLALLANFMSVADAENNKKLLKQIYEKLPAGGVCMLSGWIIDDDHLSPPVSVLFCLEDICRDAPDVERSEKVYREWLSEVGFKDVHCESYFYPTKYLCGFKK